MKPKYVQAYELWRSGKSDAEIAAALGWKESSVSPAVSNGSDYERHRAYTREYGRKRRRIGYREASLERRKQVQKRNEMIIGLYLKSGQEEAARIAGVSRNVVAGVVHRWRHSQ